MEILLNRESKLSQAGRFNVQQVAVVISARCLLYSQG